MLKMVDGTGIIGVDMVCPLGGAVSPPQPPNYDNIEMEGVGSLVLPNSLNAPLERVELIGNSVQLTTTGKNLFDKSKASDASNYITTETLAKIDITAAIVFDVRKNTNYCLSVSGKTEQPSINFNIANDVQRKSIFNKLKTEETLNSLDSGKIYVGFSGGDTELNATKLSQEYFDIQLEEASSKTPYEPYTGLKPSPSPEYPQEIKSAGRKSKNLFNIADLRVGKVKTDGTINEKETFYRSVILDVPEDGKYRITFKTNTDYDMLYFTEAYINGVYSTPFVRVFGAKSSSPIALKKGENILSFKTTKGDAQIDFSKDHNIMIAAESASLDYEPYGYFFDVKVTGKNLFNAGKARDITNWIVRDNDGYAKFPIRVGKGNKVTFSYTEKLTTGKGFYIGITQSETSAVVAWLYHSAETNLNNNKHTVVAAGDYIYLSCTKSGIQKFVDTIQTLQVEISSVQTPYEPYTEQALTLTSDRPITKWDKLVEQGGEIGWLYGSDIKTFESDVFKLYSDNDKAIQYQVPFEEITNSWDKSVCYCNTFENVIGQTIYTQSGKTDFYMGCVHKSMVFSAKNKQGIFASIETFQEWIRNSGTYVWYKTDNKKFVPLSQEEQTQLRNLHSYNGTTHITVDSGEVPCGIKLTYRKEI